METTTLAVRDREELAERRPSELTREDIETLKATICKGATDSELKLFTAVCKRTGLDPFSRQIHAVRRREKGENGQWRDSLQPMISIDGFRLIADRTGRYVPGREPIVETDANGHILKATAFVKKLVAGEWHEIAATAYFEEYVQLKDGQPMALWAGKPRTMLCKVAESLALRRAFPAELSGIYSPEEMDQADNPAPRYSPRHPESLPPANVDTATGEVLDSQPFRPGDDKTIAERRAEFEAAQARVNPPSPAAPSSEKRLTRKDLEERYLAAIERAAALGAMRLNAEVFDKFCGIDPKKLNNPDLMGACEALAKFVKELEAAVGEHRQAELDLAANRAMDADPDPFERGDNDATQ